MALPTLTANSPSVGFIAWTSFHIVYNGIDYTIPAGNTDKRYTWWPYNGGAGGALQTSDTLPALGADDFLLFLNKSGTPLLVPMTNVVDGSLIVTGSIIGDAIAANTITGDRLLANSISTRELAADSVTATAIAAGAVAANEIAAGAVTAEKLSVGSLAESIVPNGGFEDAVSGAPVGWTYDLDGSGGTYALDTSSNAGAQAMKITFTAVSGNKGSVVSAAVPVATGKTYAVTGFRKGSTATGTAILRIYWGTTAAFTPATAISSTDILTGAPTTGYVYGGLAVTPPATAKYARLGLISTSTGVAGSHYYDDIALQEVIMSAVIGDGQITTPKLVAGAVTATTIASGAVTTSALAADSVTATQIAAGAVTATELSATAIDGKTITGALMRTAASGLRWEIGGSSSDLVFYSGDTGENNPGVVSVDQWGTINSTSSYYRWLVRAPRINGGAAYATGVLYAGELSLWGRSRDGTTKAATADLIGDIVTIGHDYGDNSSAHTASLIDLRGNTVRVFLQSRTPVFAVVDGVSGMYVQTTPSASGGTIAALGAAGSALLLQPDGVVQLGDATTTTGGVLRFWPRAAGSNAGTGTYGALWIDAASGALKYRKPSNGAVTTIVA